MFSTDVAWSQIIGTRKSQQDHAAVISWPNGFRLLLLADGMGGHASGDIASKLVVNSFKEHFIVSTESNMRARLLDSLEAANIEIFKRIRKEPELSGMGTTLIALIYDGESIQWLSVGDSPMWHIRGNKIMRINENHSMSVVLAEKVAKGEMTSEEATYSPLRSQLLEAVMGENIEMFDAPESTLELEESDWLILASDGVESCTEEQILAMSQQTDAESLINDTLQAVVAVGKKSQDNATLIALRVKQENPVEETTVQPEQIAPVEEPLTKQ
tara:strand:+ start:2173 stop:2988 length:816 start_codon:yes stop_codon:yes gene_type:complete